MSSKITLDQVIAALNTALLDTERWPEAAGAICQICEATSTGFGTTDDVASANLDTFFSYYRSDCKRDTAIASLYRNEYYPFDERVRAVRRLGHGEVAHELSLLTDSERKISVAYHEFLPKAGMQNGLAVRLHAPNEAYTTWGLGDPVQGRDWSSSTVETIERLVPHVSNFIHVRQHLLEAKALDATVLEITQQSSIAMIQLDRRGRVIEANELAFSLLRRGSVLEYAKGVLRATAEGDDRVLGNLLSQALPAPGVQAKCGRATIGDHGRVRLEVHVCPVERSDVERSECTSRIAAMLFLIERSARLRPNAHSIRERYGLTEAECQVLQRLAEGESIEQVARATHRSLATVRWHKQNLLNKLHVSRQSELVRLVLLNSTTP